MVTDWSLRPPPRGPSPGGSTRAAPGLPRPHLHLGIEGTPGAQAAQPAKEARPPGDLNDPAGQDGPAIGVELGRRAPGLLSAIALQLEQLLPGRASHAASQ